jgi:hypothetical protein
MAKLTVVEGKPTRRSKEQIDEDRAAIVEFVKENATADDPWVPTNNEDMNMNLDDVKALLKSKTLVREIREVKDGNLSRRRSWVRLAGRSGSSKKSGGSVKGSQSTVGADRVYGTFDAITPKDGTYRVTLRAADALNQRSESVIVPDKDAAHALIRERGAQYVKNFRVAAKLEAAAVSDSDTA